MLTFQAAIGHQQSPTFTNIHVDIMASSGETSIKTILGPISGDISLVPSCMKM